MRVLFLVFMALVIASCTNSPDRNIVLAYGKAARDIGLFPVYPPREEFQIGDAYMWSQSTTEPNDTVSVYLDTLDWLRKKADTFMSSRIIFNNTGTVTEGKRYISASDIPQNGKNLVLRSAAPPELASSLPIAAFPSITADAGFTGSLGITNVLSSLGLGGGRRTTVTLDFQDVRTYFVPNAPNMQQVLGELPRIGRYLNEAEVELGRLVKLRTGNPRPCGQGRKCGVAVVTRVYLTRQINYTYRNAEIVAAALRRAQPGTSLSAVPAAPPVTIAVNSGAGGTVNTGDLDKQVEALRLQVDQLASGNAPGQSFRFETWSARGVTFASSYQRPVVVGWDGIELGFQ